jgi:hypothetical protein
MALKLYFSSPGCWGLLQYWRNWEWWNICRWLSWWVWEVFLSPWGIKVRLRLPTNLVSLSLLLDSEDLWSACVQCTWQITYLFSLAMDNKKHKLKMWVKCCGTCITFRNFYFRVRNCRHHIIYSLLHSICWFIYIFYSIFKPNSIYS